MPKIAAELVLGQLADGGAGTIFRPPPARR